MSKLFARFRKNESGATAIEYGLIAALIAVAIIAGAGALGDSLDGQFQWLSEQLDGTQTTGGNQPPANPANPT